MIPFLIFTAAAALLVLAATAVMFRTAVVSRRRAGNGERNLWNSDECFEMALSHSERFDKYGDIFRRGCEWLKEAGRSELSEELSILSEDGLRLRGRMIRNPSERGIVLMCHGYRSNPARDFGSVAKTIYSMGFSLLLIDQRAHGGSDGKYITYGTKERYDVAEWCRLLSRLYSDAPVILYGISMGATAVMMAAGLPELPTNVAALIADCGFTSPCEILRHVMRRRYHLPVFPVYHIFSLITRLAAGFSLNGADTRDALRRAELPMLIVHGSADKLVPLSMGEENRRAAGDALFLRVEGAGHLCAFAGTPDEYTAAVRRLLEAAGI